MTIEVVSKDKYSDFRTGQIVLAGIMAVSIALLTVIYQAVKAAIANPVDSLRDE